MKNEVMERGKLLICDDHLLFCEGLRSIITEAFPLLDVIVFNDLENTSEFISNNEIGTFICDVNIKGQNGIELIDRYKEKLARSITIIISAYFDPFIIKKAKNLGASYFLNKEVSKEELLSAITGDHPNNLKELNTAQTSVSRNITLSRQEREIIRLVSEGFQSKEIGQKLFISKATVDTHRRNIHRKLNTSTSTEIIKLIYEGKLKI